jgi:hypothetical protein
LTVADDEHGTPEDRIAAVNKLAQGRSGFEGRAELLRHIDRLVVGRDTRLGRRVGDAWVIAALGVAFELDADDVVRSADDLLVLRRGRVTLTAYVIGAPWGRELIAGLEEREIGTNALGRVTAGTVPRRTRLDDSPLGKLKRAIRGTLPQPSGGARVAILERPRGALVLEIGGHRIPTINLRDATPQEIAAAEPARIEVHRATSPGTITSLGLCTGRLFDDPARKLVTGDSIKCVDRVPEPHLGHERDVDPLATD